MLFQLGSALLDACVLSVLAQNDAYGYVITQAVQGVLPVSESTLYPVLKRLQREEYLTTYDLPFQGRNRRYYSVTEKGAEKLGEYRDEWGSYKKKVDLILEEGLLINEHDKQ